MTLDLEKFISNSIKTQAKIQHLDISTKTVKKIPNSVKSAITSGYGEKYLLDADYVSFFWGAITKDDIKKLFNVVDKALGQSANRLTETDFKKISFEDDSPVEDEDSSKEETEVEDIEDSEEPEFEDTTEEIEIEDNDLDDTEEDESDDSSEDDSLNEDGEIKQQVQAPKTSYFFLKITLK